MGAWFLPATWLCRVELAEVVWPPVEEHSADATLRSIPQQR